MTQADVLISWYATNDAVQAVRSEFVKPTRFIEMPSAPEIDYVQQLAAYGNTPIQELIRQRLPGITPMRVGILGFSQGCRALRACLMSGDGPRIDAILAIDGIHSQWVKAGETFESAYLTAYEAAARAAVAGGPLFVITTSATKPAFVSTTTTSDWIWEQATGSPTIAHDEPELPPFLYGQLDTPYVNPPGTFGPGQQSWKETTYDSWPLRMYRRRGELVIINSYNADPTGVGDHRFQAARVSPMVLSNYLVPRWNQTPWDAACPR